MKKKTKFFQVFKKHAIDVFLLEICFFVLENYIYIY